MGRLQKGSRVIMNISKSLDYIRNIKNKKIASLVYKMCKVIANIEAPNTACKGSGVDEKSKVIISLTSFPQRIDTVCLTIKTLLNQTVKPQKVILWLAQNQFIDGDFSLPSKLLELKTNGLTIEYCDDLGPHKKYYYAMQRYPDNWILTVDDDILYPSTLLEELINCAESNPQCVCCTWVHEITLDKNGNINPYKEWDKGTSGLTVPSLRLLPVGCGGVLYPPHFLSNEVFNLTAIKELCPRTDDLWLKAMALKNRVPAVRINKSPLIFYSIIRTQKWGLHFENAGKEKNDVSLSNILKQYSEIANILKTENDIVFDKIDRTKIQ